MLLAIDKRYSPTSSEHSEFPVNGDEGRDSWMYKVIRTKGRDMLSPKQATYIIFCGAQGTLQKNVRTRKQGEGHLLGKTRPPNHRLLAATDAFTGSAQ